MAFLFTVLCLFAAYFLFSPTSRLKENLYKKVEWIRWHFVDIFHELWSSLLYFLNPIYLFFRDSRLHFWLIFETVFLWTFGLALNESSVEVYAMSFNKKQQQITRDFMHTMLWDNLPPWTYFSSTYTIISLSIFSRRGVQNLEIIETSLAGALPYIDSFYLSTILIIESLCPYCFTKSLGDFTDVFFYFLL